MSKLCLGMEYHEFNASSIDATVYISRIDPSQTKFVVGSINNNTYTKDALQTEVYRRRNMLTVRSSVRKLKSETIRVEQSKGRFEQLRPVWISNGTFHVAHFPLFQRILGPVVHRRKAVADITPILIGGADSISKSERWMIDQPAENKYSRVNIIRNSPRRSADYLSGSEEEVLGGAGLLISNGQPANLLVSNGQSEQYKFWHSPIGGKFSGGQTYSAGPIFARCSGGKTIYYVIILKENTSGNYVNWFEAASYLCGQFKTDFKSKRSPSLFDPPIQEACVFDGGSSRQLWIHNTPVQLRFPQPPNDVAVPNYLCIWGDTSK